MPPMRMVSTPNCMCCTFPLSIKIDALMIACDKGHHECVDWLLAELGKKITKTRDRNGMTALMYACRRGYQNCVDCLLRAGADKEAYDNSGMTALMHASNEKKQECVDYLLQAGAKQSKEKKKKKKKKKYKSSSSLLDQGYTHTNTCITAHIQYTDTIPTHVPPTQKSSQAHRAPNTISKH